MVEKKTNLDPEQLHIQFFENLLASPFQESFEIKNKHRTTTPLTKYRSQNPTWKESLGRKARSPRTTTIRTDIVAILSRGLGHIAANPSVTANRRALGESYTFPYEVESDQFSHLGLSEDILIVNRDGPTAENFFVKTMGDAAEKAAQIFENKLMGSTEIDSSTDAIMREDKFLMIGERGIGKTFLLNYLLSTFTKKLHERRTIVVRLDLTKDVAPTLSIEEWLQWKICKIIFVYYDRSTFNRDAVHDANDPAFEHFIEKERCDMLFDLQGSQIQFEIAKSLDPKLSRTDFETKYRSEASVFRSPTNSIPKKIETPWFFPMLWDFLIKVNRCRFVVVFDGLDQMGLTKGHKARYQRLVESVSSYLSGEKSLWAATLVTMRPKTFRDQIGDNNFRKGFMHVVVAQTPPNEIFMRRQGYIRNPLYFSHRHPTVKVLGNQYSPVILGFSQAFMKFAAQSLIRSISPDRMIHGSEVEVIRIGFDTIEKIFGEDRRKAFQALSDAAAFFAAALPEKFENAISDAGNINSYFDGLETGITFDIDDPYREISKYHYLFVEALMLETTKHGFRREKYTYSVLSGGELEPIPVPHDTLKHYIHNVFHYARNPTREIVSHSLLGIRILQCSRQLKMFDAEELAKFLCAAFGYEMNIVTQKFDEMLEDGLFKPYITEDYVVANSYVSAYAGNYLLEVLSLSLEYICLALQTSPLPVSAVDGGAFPVRHHSSSEFVVFNKLLSALNFCRYLEMIEANERKGFESYRKARTGFQEKYFVEELPKFNCFETTKRMSSEVLRSVKRIISHAHSSGIAHQISNLDSIFSSGGVEKYS